MGKKVIRLTEADIKNIVKKVISEQNERVLVNELNDKIQSVMIEKQNEIFSDVKVEVDQNGDNLVLKFSSENESPFNITLRPQGTGSYSVAGTFDRNIPSIPLSNFYDEIFKDKDLRRYYEENEYIKSQMDELKVPVRMYSDPRVVFTIFILDNKRKLRRSDDYVKGAQTNLDFFFSNAGAKFGVNRDMILDTEVGGLVVKLGEVNILPPQPPEQPEPVQPTVIAPQTIELDLVDVFKYDDIDIVNPTEYQTTLKNFQIKLNNAVTNIEGFKDFLNGKTLTVNGYASQDDDPAANIGGKLPACSKYVKGPRSEYNKCLSQERAQKVADDLQTIFDELVGAGKIQVNAKGNGETHDFGGQGWDSEEKKTLDSKEDLAKNRRVTFVLPSFTEKL